MIMKNNQKLRQKWASLKKALGLEELKKEIRALEKKMKEPNFWRNPARAQQVLQELAAREKLWQEVQDLEQIFRQSPLPPSLASRLQKLELQTFLTSPYDRYPALLSLHAGQGGVEAMDWTAMLLRMYLRYGEKKGWPMKIIQEIRGEEAGIKSVTVEINQPYCYGYLKHEHGTHRLVRRSPFNANNLRQTSFALVEVLPLLGEDTLPQLQIQEKDLLVETFRSSGPGGQHANKTESAVRLKHLPTGLTVTVSSSRSQLSNRKTALNLLKGKLFQLMQQQKVARIQELKGHYVPPTWGQQIRSYILDPYQLVKDHRTGVTEKNAQAVLDGDLEAFISAEVRKIPGKNYSNRA